MNEVLKREKDGIEYVRRTDLTLTDQALFSNFLYGSQVPVIQGEGDVAYYWDYKVWRQAFK